MEFTNELQRKTEDCLDLFQNPSGTETLADDDWFEDRAAEFLWWSHGLKAQKNGRSSLDYRLKDRPDIQNVVTGLLDTLATSLNKYQHADQESSRSARDGSCSESDKSSSGSSWSEFSDEPNEPKSKDDAADDTRTTESDPKFYIETSLKMLARISIAIKRSGTKLRYLKADEHLLTHSNDDEYTQLRSHLLFLILIGPYERCLFAELQRRVINKQTSIAVEIVVRSWLVDPSRATTIQKRLIEANIIRRSRITYARRFISRRATKSQSQETHVPVPIPSRFPKTFGTAKQPSTFGAEAPEPTLLPLPMQLEHGGPKPVETVTANTLTATELGSQFVLPIIMPLEKKRGTLTFATKMTKTGTEQDYPACPIKKGSFQCPYCVQILTQDYATKSRWRGHVAQDLNPYSCIYEACADSHTLFATKEEWAKHTTTQHNSERWVCDDCILESDQDDEFVFNSRELWENHMRCVHNCSDNRLTILRNLSKRALPQVSTCPLCRRPGKTSRPDEDDHIAEHLHAWALRALPWDLNPDDEVSSDSPEMGSDDDMAGMSGLSERSEDKVDREEAAVLDAIDREVNWLRDESVMFSSRIAELIYTLDESIQNWNAHTRLDAQNEIMLWYLTSINQIKAQLSHVLQTESEENQFTTQQQEEIEAGLCAHIELVIEYINEVRMVGGTTSEEASYSSHFPKVRGHNIPPAYDEVEGILQRARDNLPDTGSSTLSISWARDVLVWADITGKLRERRLKVQVASDNELAFEALEIITLWASRLNPEALYYEGKWFELGQFGRKKDLEKAKVRYVQSVNGDFPRAEYRLGMVFEQSGQLEAALGHYENAEMLGDSAASYCLALKKLKSADLGELNIQKGLALLHRSAETADSDAPQGAYTYGMTIARRLDDLAVEESLLPFDESRACSYIEKSAYLGFADGQLRMGQFYQYQELGCPKDLAKAFHYYHLAAAQGLPDAVSLMSEWLISGLDGVLLPNNELSFKFAQWGAAKSHPNAEYVLGMHYHKGLYVKRDLREAERWYNLAVRHSYNSSFESTNTAARKKIEDIGGERPPSRTLDDRPSDPAPISIPDSRSTIMATDSEVDGRLRRDQAFWRSRTEDDDTTRLKLWPEGKTIVIGIDLGALFSSVSWADSSRSHEIYDGLGWYNADANLEPDGRIPTDYNQLVRWKTISSQLVRRDSSNSPQDAGFSVLKDLCSSVVEVHTKATRFLIAHLEALWHHAADRIFAETQSRAGDFIISLSVPVSFSFEAMHRLRSAAWTAMAMANVTNMVQINVESQMKAIIMYALSAQYRQEESARGPSIAIEDRDIVVVCDCGATGVRAVSYEVLTQSPPLIRTLTSWDSQEYGTRSVDMTFIDYLFNRSGWGLGGSESTLSTLNRFVHRDWEHGLKRSFTGDEKATVQLPSESSSGFGHMGQFHKGYPLNHEIRNFFYGTLSSIERVINSQLEALERLRTKPNSIILAGGLAQSPYIASCLQEKFDILFQPSNSNTTISRGLVELEAQWLLHQSHPVLAEVEG